MTADHGAPRRGHLHDGIPAALELDGGGEVALGPGDWTDLPRRCRHRVAWTAPDRDTIWLAVFRR